MFLAYSQSVKMLKQCLFRTKFSFSPIPPLCACGSTAAVLSPFALVLRAVKLRVSAPPLGPGAAVLSTYACA